MFVPAAVRAEVVGMSPPGPRVIYHHQFKKRRARRKPSAVPKPELTVEQILAWADSYHLRTGRWPKRDSGRISPTVEGTWQAIEVALAKGLRGLPGGSSLARLLADCRGVRNPQALPPLTVPQILTWADTHHTRTGKWPNAGAGPVAHAPGETWHGIDVALSLGRRRLPGGSSLARVLATHRGVRNVNSPPRLSVEVILTWADAHHTRTGRWPTAQSGPIPEAPGETWAAADSALRDARRGLPGGSSLARLLAEYRGMRNLHTLPPLTPEVILGWADAHHARTGKWPTQDAGAIPEAPGENWRAIDACLRAGRRGLPGGSSVSWLLVERRGRQNHFMRPRLTIGQVLTWADAHHTRTGRWPAPQSGPIPEAPGDTWAIIDSALKQGIRGLPGGTSLTRLLAAQRGTRNPKAPPPLTPELVLAWADAHHARVGQWPGQKAGSIPEAPGETWMTMEHALFRGRRGLPGGTTLSRFLKQHGRI